MSTSLESQILLAIWTMYKRNEISMEQKGWIKGNSEKLQRSVNQKGQQFIFIYLSLQIIKLNRRKGSPRDFDAEENIYPIIRLSNQSSSPTTTQSQLNYPEKRFRFKSSNNEIDSTQNANRIRSNSYHHK